MKGNTSSAKLFLSLFIGMFFFFSATIQAQELWYTGWVVLNNGDTLKGKINYNVYTLDNFHVIKIKDAKGFQRKIIAQHMLVYQVGEYRYMRHTVKNGGKDIANDQAMIKRVVSGEIEVWEYEFDPHIARPSAYQPGGFSENTQKDYYIIKQGSPPFFVNRLYLLNDLKKFTDDAALFESIIGESKAEYSKIPFYFEEYNRKKSTPPKN
jgi:hypothetical protein